MDRRKFLSNTTRQLVAINLAGFTTNVFASHNAVKSLVVEKKMKYRVLGKTGIKIPVVSMGVMNANNPNLLKGAWDAGIRHFDTAWFYQNGNNERMVGSVLRELNVNREDVTIATKIGLFGPPLSNGKDRKELFLRRFNQSMTRLQMDYVDILYYHMPPGLDEINDPYVLEAFSELKDKKRIRFSGFSTHSDWPDLVNDAARKKCYDVILLSFNYAMHQDQRVFGALQAAHNEGIGLVAMKTQCQQDWYKNELPADQQKYYNEGNMNTALLKWALRHEYITTAIPGFTTFQQLEEDIAVGYDLEYSEGEKDFLNSRDVQLAIQAVCRHCGKCVETCPNNIDIPSLMRTHMYSFSYGNLILAKQTLNQIEPGKGIDMCKDCLKCSGSCQYRVPIANHISDLKEVYC